MEKEKIDNNSNKSKVLNKYIKFFIIILMLAIDICLYFGIGLNVNTIEDVFGLLFLLMILIGYFISLLFVLVVVKLYYILKYKQKLNLIEFFKNNKIFITLFIILIIGFIVLFKI